MTRLAIVGGRDFDDYEELCFWADGFNHPHGVWDCLEIVSGGAKGADTLASLYAEERELALTVFLPDWDQHGRSAGFKRNVQIVDYCDYLIAFWDGKSKGTKHSIDLATKAGKLFKIVGYING